MATPKAEARLGDLVAAIGKRHRKAWQQHVESLPVAMRNEPAAIEHLPEAAWQMLKRNILGQIDQRHPARGWLQMRDLLHEARAFHHLSRLGCTEISFSTPTMTAKSPDLVAICGTRRVLCEVKTVRLRRADELPATFVRKLNARLIDAERQLAAKGDETAWRLIYLIIDANGLDPNDRVVAEIVEILRKSMPAGLTLAIDMGGRVTEIN